MAPKLARTILFSSVIVTELSDLNKHTQLVCCVRVPSLLNHMHGHLRRCDPIPILHISKPGPLRQDSKRLGINQ